MQSKFPAFSFRERLIYVFKISLLRRDTKDNLVYRIRPAPSMAPRQLLRPEPTPIHTLYIIATYTPSPLPLRPT